MRKVLKRLALPAALAAFLLSGCSTGKPVDFSTLRDDFKSPPSEYGVDCWWWWLNGNVAKESITKELEAMKSRSFYGAMVFDAGGHNQRGNKDILAGPLFGSEEWNDLFVYALDEARRLGLEIGFNIQSGWNLGGPRVTPRYAAKQLVYSKKEIIGGVDGDIVLEKPDVRKDFYEDVAVLAFPLKEENRIDGGIDYLPLKLGVHEIGGSAPDCRFLLCNDGADRGNLGKSTFVVKREDVQNLTESLDSEGHLAWNALDGNWVVMRIGYTCTNASVSTSSSAWQGNVLDYMSREAFDFYWNDVVEPILKAAGDHVGTTLKYMETDSWECGGMNWTDCFAEEFKDYCGYDAVEYLPVVAGYVVDDFETTDAFLADFRKTIAELVAKNHYALFSEYAHRNNMGIQPESAGPHAGPLDGLKNYGYSDIVMSEFWSPSPHRPRPENRFFLKQASSAAHIYGKKIVGAESFTTIGPHWNDELWHDQKSAFDHEICDGLNRVYFHTFTSSPSSMGLPGQEYFAGTHVNPRVTWWDESAPFIDYMRRTQLVVQNGSFVGDVLYYYGDHVPNVFPYKESDPAGAMPGFDYDVTDETVLLQLRVKGGKVVVPTGLEYEVLVLPDHRVLSLAALKKVRELLRAGASVIGFKPERCVSLVGGIKAREEFARLADEIWGDADPDRGERKNGRGTVAWGISSHDYLVAKGLAPDFAVADPDKRLEYIHYKVDGRDVYFVANQSDEPCSCNCVFRVSGRRPELWDALSGEIRIADAFTQDSGCTTVPLSFDPFGSAIVVFDGRIGDGENGTGLRNYPVFGPVMSIDGSWTVQFDTTWGGPSCAEFSELSDWSQSEDERIRYYSGAAVYSKSFSVDFPVEEKPYFLELGSVKDVGIAVVTVNETSKGIVWTKPFRVDISGDLREGENSLEIKVVNSWFNRVAGDELASDGQRRYTSTNIVLGNDFRGQKLDAIKLQPSGLMGPVRIVRAD